VVHFKQWKKRNITFWRINNLSYRWRICSKLASEFRFFILAATVSLLSLIHLKSIEAFHWGFPPTKPITMFLISYFNFVVKKMRNKVRRGKWPWSSGMLVVAGEVWTAAEEVERGLVSRGNGNLWEWMVSVLVLWSEGRTKIEEEEVEASLKVLKVVLFR
jgi:hypothetical protein